MTLDSDDEDEERRSLAEDLDRALQYIAEDVVKLSYEFLAEPIADSTSLLIDRPISLARCKELSLRLQPSIIDEGNWQRMGYHMFMRCTEAPKVALLECFLSASSPDFLGMLTAAISKPSWSAFKRIQGYFRPAEMDHVTPATREAYRLHSDAFGRLCQEKGIDSTGFKQEWGQ